MVELVNYYERHPLYKKIKLNHPVNQDVIRKMELVAYFTFLFIVIFSDLIELLHYIQDIDDGSVYGIPGYMDPTSFTSKVSYSNKRIIYTKYMRHLIYFKGDCKSYI